MIEKKSRMSNSSTRTYNKIWRWIFSSIKVGEKSFFIKSFRINSFSKEAFDSPYDLILSTIGYCKYAGHLISFFGLFDGVKKKCSDIRRNEPKISDNIESYRILDELLDQLWNFITK